MGESIFTKIINGEIPCHRVYEDDHTLAFLDINPLSKGHTLVIPKEPAPTLDALSPESGAAIGRALPAICRAVCKAVGTSEYNVLQNNGAAAHQAVFHVHVHIIPKHDGGGLEIGWEGRVTVNGKTFDVDVQKPRVRKLSPAGRHGRREEEQPRRNRRERRWRRRSHRRSERKAHLEGPDRHYRPDPDRVQRRAPTGERIDFDDGVTATQSGTSATPDAPAASPVHQGGT